MSTQSDLDTLLSSFNVNQDNLSTINELKECFDENHIEVFLEKLNEIDNIDELLESTDENNHAHLFLDFVSELVINE